MIITHIVSATEPVHTTGINWASVATITIAITTVMSILFSLLARYVSNRISSSIDKLRLEVINKMEERVTVLEQKDQARADNEARRRR